MMLPDNAGIVARSHRPEYSLQHLGWVCEWCHIYLPGGDRDGMMPPPTPTEDQCPEWRLVRW